jgi:dTDP-4-amino-4,6-dideoxygalactose transaminase
MSTPLPRRTFLKTVVSSASLLGAAGAPNVFAAATDKPALLGGKPVRSSPFPGWPVFDEREERALTGTLRSGRWGRGGGGSQVGRFETAFAELMGARHCVATANGTSALFASLGGLGVGPGDEVILPPYTFVATLNVVFLQYALPVFVDTDPETFQMDARKLKAAITDRTTAIIPVHLGGGAADMDTILAVAGERRIPVIEDACQAHLAEWRGRKVGTLGATGCFSFQASKNLNSGEGGAILTNDLDLAEKCYAFHNNCRGRGTAGYDFTYLGSRGANLRLTEFQGALLQAQMTRLEEQSRTREQNAAHLTRLLEAIPGIMPAKTYAGCTRNAWHLYMFRYQAGAFAGLPRAKFLQALSAEGIPCSGGYTPLNEEPFIKAMLQSRAYRRLYPAEVLAGWEERTACPANRQLCGEAVWFTQPMLLGPRADVDHIAEAIGKIHRHAAELARA